MNTQDSEYEVSGEVHLFPQEAGWHYVPIPPWITDELSGLADRGVIAVRATVGSSSWDTSLLPKGDGTHFIALNAKVRKATGLAVGDTARVTFTPRTR